MNKVASNTQILNRAPWVLQLKSNNFYHDEREWVDIANCRISQANPLQI
jgi:hypothetical protein